MSLVLRKAPLFIGECELQYEWYYHRAGEKTAERYLSALDGSLALLVHHPGAGPLRRYKHPLLKGIRSFRVSRPFDRHLIFYRFDDSTLYAERVIHGMRDLPRRLLEPPESEAF